MKKREIPDAIGISRIFSMGLSAQGGSLKVTSGRIDDSSR